MAIDLLDAIEYGESLQRLYRHDAESFAWVLLWICTRYNKGLLIEHAPLEEWTTMTFRQCADNKANIKLSRLQATSDYKSYWPVVETLVDFWIERYQKQQRAIRRKLNYAELSDEKCVKQVLRAVVDLASENSDLKFPRPTKW